MIEVEIKVRISDPELMRQNFEAKGGIYKLSLLHEDTYYNMPENLRDFKKTDEALRIRKSVTYHREEKNSKNPSKYYITYKGKKMDILSKTREELETSIKDGEKVKEILTILGFREIFTVNKERELYEFNYKNHQIKALIDYLPILKEYFIEVEYTTESNKEIDEAREILFDFLENLGFKKEDSITKSYLELILDKNIGKLN